MRSYEWADWSRENINAVRAEEEAGEQLHLEYGHQLLRAQHMDRIVFAGTETEAENGHMEGALLSGKRAANEAHAILMRGQMKNMDAQGNVYRK
jgi:monoamine oxidase